MLLAGPGTVGTQGPLLELLEDSVWSWYALLNPLDILQAMSELAWFNLSSSPIKPPRSHRQPL